MSAPRVFVSHSHRDDEFTQRLVADLSAAGADVWVDVAELDRGDFLKKINEALASRDWLVLVLSQNAIESDYVQMEVNAAIHRTQQGFMAGVVPMLAGPCILRDIPPLWATLQRYDATRDYMSALSGVLKSMGLSGSQSVQTVGSKQHTVDTRSVAPPLSTSSDETLGVRRGSWENYNPPPGPDGPLFQDFYMKLVPELRRRGLKYTPSTIDFASRCEFGAGHKDCLFVALFTGQRQARVSFDINRKDNKHFFDALTRYRKQIESAFGASLSWERNDGKQVARIAAYFPGEITIHSSPAELHRLLTWMTDCMLNLQHALDPWLEQLDR